MLTTRKLEILNGHAATVTRSADNKEFLAKCTCDCVPTHHMLLIGTGSLESLALERLRDMVLNEHRLIVLNRAGWKCENCSAVAGLSVHHKVYRSHGRDDRVVNLESCCSRCHGMAHGIKQGVS